LHTLTAVVAGAHVNRWPPGGTCAFVVDGNEQQIVLQEDKKVNLNRFHPLQPQNVAQNA